MWFESLWLKNYFHFKDFFPELLWSNWIFTFSCRRCIASYIGKNFRYFKVRVPEHQGVSLRTGEAVKGTVLTFVSKHMLIFDYKVMHENFKIHGNYSNRYTLKLKENLFIVH